MVRLFQNQTGKPAVVNYNWRPAGYRWGPAAQSIKRIEPGEVIIATNDAYAEMYAKAGLVDLGETVDEPHTPRKFKNVSKCLQRFTPSWKEYNLNDVVDIPVGGIVESANNAQAAFWARMTTGRHSVLEEIFGDEKAWSENSWGKLVQPK